MKAADDGRRHVLKVDKITSKPIVQTRQRDACGVDQVVRTVFPSCLFHSVAALVLCVKVRIARPHSRTQFCCGCHFFRDFLHASQEQC